MTDQDFVDIINFARSKGAVMVRFHPLLWIVTTPEYADAAPGLAPAQSVPLPLAVPGEPLTNAAASAC